LALDTAEKKAVDAQFLVMVRTLVTLLGGALLFAWALSRAIPEPAEKLILYPAFPMFLLVAVVLTSMGVSRVGAVLNGGISIRFYRTYDEGEEPERLRVITRNFINLFEMPLLFHVGLVLIYVSEQGSPWLLGLAWAYVALRYLHTYVHLRGNNVPVRLAVYTSSGLVLLILWITWFARLVSSA